MPAPVAMNLSGYEFEHVCGIEPRRDAAGAIAIVLPQARYKGAATVALNRYGSGPFCKFTVPNRYTFSGVYLLLIGDEARYVGECANLSARFNAGYGNISPRNCFKGGQETNCRVNNLVYVAAMSGESVALWFHSTASYKEIEATMRAALRLAWNLV